MATKTKSALSLLAQEIATEVSPGANTAPRVGGLDQDIIDSYVHIEDPPTNAPVAIRYADIAGMIAAPAQSLQVNRFLYSVESAAAAGITGRAYYEYKGTATGALSDYNFVSSEVPAPQPYADLIPQATPPAHQEARFYYDDVKKNFVIYNDITDVSLDVGLEMWTRVKNQTGVTITNGSLVYVNGVNGGGLPTIALAKSDLITTSSVLGFATHDIETATNGYITTYGTISDVSTVGLTANDQLYLSDSVAGAFTAAAPLPPSSRVPVGRVNIVGALGQIAVKVETIIAPEEITMAANFNSAVGVTGSDNYVKGYYTFDAGYTPIGGGNTFGTLGVMYGAHYYFVLGAASTDMVIRVTGDSWDESAEVVADFELVDTSAGSIDDYFQTSKKWNGQVTITLESGTGIIVNSGYAHYWDNNNRRFILTQLLWTGVAGANDAGPDFLVIKHSSAGWTYNAAGAIRPTAIIDLQNEITDGGLATGQEFSFKLSGFTDVIAGDNEEGIITVINYNSNNSISYSDIEYKLLQ